MMLIGRKARQLLNEKKDNAQTMRKERWIVGAKGPILRSNDDAQMMRRERRYENRRQVEVKDPTSFGTSKAKPLFSGPQAGEKLPPLMATGIRGRTKGKTFDFHRGKQMKESRSFCFCKMEMAQVWKVCMTFHA